MRGNNRNKQALSAGRRRRCAASGSEVFLQILHHDKERIPRARWAAGYHVPVYIYINCGPLCAPGYTSLLVLALTPLISSLGHNEDPINAATRHGVPVLPQTQNGKTEAPGASILLTALHRNAMGPVQYARSAASPTEHPTVNTTKRNRQAVQRYYSRRSRNWRPGFASFNLRRRIPVRPRHQAQARLHYQEMPYSRSRARVTSNVRCSLALIAFADSRA